jgi:hypothetical protein
MSSWKVMPVPETAQNEVYRQVNYCDSLQRFEFFTTEVERLPYTPLLEEEAFLATAYLGEAYIDFPQEH